MFGDPSGPNFLLAALQTVFDIASMDEQSRFYLEFVTDEQADSRSRMLKWNLIWVICIKEWIDAGRTEEECNNFKVVLAPIKILQQVEWLFKLELW